MQISREVFDRQRRPRFGTTNPERMQLAFWEWMIRGDDCQPPDEGSPLNQFGLIVRGGILKSSYGPYRARDLFQVPLNRDDGPIWTFDRMGSTRTQLPDGRIVCVGGEHEDDYDPDFCIYNDVVVVGPADQVEIYGYPKEVFPPTDCHTACLIGDRIIIVGCLGYPNDRRLGQTPVYALDLNGYRITPIETTGTSPGWLFNHEASIASNDAIQVRGGEGMVERNGQLWKRRNFDDYSLDLGAGIWHRLTDRQWRQFSIHREDRDWLPLKTSIKPENVFPAELKEVEMLGVSAEEPNFGVFHVHGCPVSARVGSRNIEVVIHGPLPVDLTTQFVDAVRAKAEALVQHACVFEEL